MKNETEVIKMNKLEIMKLKNTTNKMTRIKVDDSILDWR